MKKKIILLTVLGVFICSAFYSVTAWGQTGPREDQVPVSTKKPNLQSILDSVFGAGNNVHAEGDQQAAQEWFVSSYPKIIKIELVAENTNLAGYNVFGIWSDPSDPNKLIPIFFGSAGSKDTATILFDSDGNVIISGDSKGASPKVNVGTFPGIEPCSFGFYLSRNGGTTFYTLDLSNPGGYAQALSYRLNDTWVIAFNDLPPTNSDYDYNDLVVKLDFLKAFGEVPLPPTLVSPIDGESWVNIMDYNYDPTNPKPLTLSWNASCGANFYELEISPPVGEIPSQINNTWYAPNDIQNDTTYYWRVKAWTTTGTESAWSETWEFTTAPYYGNVFAQLRGTIDPDDDGDGIDNGLETEILKTSSSKKTLFVRPKKYVGKDAQQNPIWNYWDGFASLFQGTNGFADIPQLTNRNIEVVVIGASDHLYGAFNSFTYNPVTDAGIISWLSSHPTINSGKPDILEIEYYPSTVENVCWSQSHRGHIFLASATAGWSWDTKGFTPNTTGPYGYKTATICEFALSKYFTEGAYSSLAKGKRAVGTDCNTSTCNQKSPMNLSGTYPSYGIPNDTVEFNAFTFSDSRGTISSVPTSPGNPYTMDEVRRRTIVHELGHALMNGLNTDHCEDPGCIMYNRVKDWNMYPFGGPTSQYNCTHRPGLSNDISNKIHNSFK